MAAPFGAEPNQPSEKQLKQVLRNIKYPNHVAAAKQIVSSLDSLYDLRTSVKEYTLKDGKKMDLMLLDANIPVKISDNEFVSIPIHIWLLRGFPKECPLVFVVSTNDQELASVNYTDDKGKIKLPYLVDWKDTRSDLSTMGKMLKYKFGQQCPLNLILSEPRLPPVSLMPPASIPNMRQSYSDYQSNYGITDSTIVSVPPLPPPTTTKPPKLDPNLLHMKIDLEKKDREISSYLKTIQALTDELNSLGKRVKELEHTQRLAPKDNQGKGKIDKDLMEELENIKEEKATYQELLKEQTERFQLELQEKAAIQAKLNSKISDLTQTREKVAILEVDLEDYHHKLHRTIKELKQSRLETREVAAINKELKSQIATLAELDHSNSLCQENELLENANLRIQQLEDALSDSSNRVDVLERERNVAIASMESMASEFQELENNLMAEKDDLERQLYLDAKEFASTQCQTEHPMEDSKRQSILSLSPNTRDNGGVPFVTINHWTQTDPRMGLCDKEVQEDNLKAEDVNILNEEIVHLKRDIGEYKVKLKKMQKDSEIKICQLLSFKENLSKKNEELQQKVTDLQQQNPNICVIKQADINKFEEEIEALKNEKKNLVIAHGREKQDIVKKIGNIKENMLKKNTEYEKEINDLKEQIKKISLHAQNGSSQAQLNGTSAHRRPESIVSSKELSITGSIKVLEGSWGYVMEGTFRGTSVAMRVVSNSNIKQFSVDVIYEQIRTLSTLRHPNIVLFVAVALDTLEGLIIVTELYPRTLKQALYEPYSVGINRLPAMLDIALALSYLHLQIKPITHGSLNSDCVSILEVSGQPWKAKLCDMGQIAPFAMLRRPEEMPMIYKGPSTRGSASTSVDVYNYGVLLSEASLAVDLTNTQEMNTLLVCNVKEKFPAIFSLIQACFSKPEDQRPTMGTLVSKIQNLVSNRVKLTAAIRK